MGNGSLPTCSKNTITDNTGNPAYLKHFYASRKPVETEKVHPDISRVVSRNRILCETALIFCSGKILKSSILMSFSP